MPFANKVDKRIWWLTVSKAADRSSKISIEDLESTLVLGLQQLRGSLGWMSTSETRLVAVEEVEDKNECMFAGKMCLTDCVVENCALMVLILVMKNVAKSSAIRVYEGGGGRTKEGGKCFKEKTTGQSEERLMNIN